MAWLHKSVLLAPAFLGTVFAGVCGAADTRPSDGDQWFRGQTLRPDDRPAPNATSAGRDFGGPPPQMAQQPPAAEYPTSDFPDDQVHDWVVASARAAHSRAMFRRAENELNDAVRTAQFTFENSDDYKRAVADEKRAYDAYNAERNKALQSVLKDPKYKASIELRDQVGDQITRLRSVIGKSKDAPREQLLALASQKLQFASDAHAMEADALEKDDALKDARQKMVQASARVAELRAQFDLSVRNNPQILMARRNLEDSRVALITSQAYLTAAASAGYLATDYAYYRHRADYLRSYNTYGWDFWGPGGYRY